MIYHESYGPSGKTLLCAGQKGASAYDNPFYWENTPEAEAFRTFLLTKTTVPEDKMEAVFVDIYYGLHCMNAGLEDVLNRLDEIGVEFRRKVDVAILPRSIPLSQPCADAMQPRAYS